MMALTDSIAVLVIFGEDMRFWMTVLIASFLKWLFTPDRRTLKESVAGITAGAVAAYYGTDTVIRYFNSLTLEDRDLVVIGLVITGEHVTRIAVQYGPRMIDKTAGIERKAAKTDDKK